MKIDLSAFNLADLMGALGAAESAMRTIDEAEDMPRLFKGQMTSWADQLNKLSVVIAETHNGEVK